MQVGNSYEEVAEYGKRHKVRRTTHLDLLMLL